MQQHPFFSPSGQIKPRPFILTAVAVYILGAASHLLTAPDVMTRVWLWPFIAAQAVLIWFWFVLHARRLHDSGHGSGLAIGVALLYVLSIVLLVILAAAFYSISDSPLGSPNGATALGLMLFLYIAAGFAATSDYGLGWAVVAILTFLAFVPMIAAVVLTLWAAAQPSVGEKT